VHSIIVNAKKCKFPVAASKGCRNIVVSDCNYCRFFGLPTDFLDISTHLVTLLIHSYKLR